MKEDLGRRNAATLAGGDAARPPRRVPKTVWGWLFAAAGLTWVLQGLEWQDFARQLAHLDWRWVALAVACDVLSYLSQGVRWRLLLKPVGDLSTRRATQAIYAGLFANEILPMRVGELVRAYLAARWTAVKFIAVIPSMVVERVFDGWWVAVGLGLTALFVPLPPGLLRAAGALGVAVVVAAAALLALALRREEVAAGWGARRAGRAARAWSWLAERLGRGMRGAGRTRAFYLALGWSLLLLIFQALAFWLVTLACGLRLSFWAGVAVFLIVHVGTAVPSAPANVGAYQFFTVVGLTLFGVEKTSAAGFSVIVFMVLTLPLLLLGSLALSRSGATLVSIRREVRGAAGGWEERSRCAF